MNLKSIASHASDLWGPLQARILRPPSRDTRVSLAVGLLLVASVLWQWADWRAPLARELNLRAAKKQFFGGTVVGDPKRKIAGELRFEFQTRFHGRPARLLLSSPDLPWEPTTQLQRGDKLRLSARLWSVWRRGERQTPFAYGSYLLRRGIQGRGAVLEIYERRQGPIRPSIRERFVSRIVRKFPQSESLGVILAMNIAVEDLLAAHQRELFRRTGTSHLLVVSGFHVSCVFALLFKLLSFFLARANRLVSRVPVDVVAAPIAFVLSLAFVAFIDWPLPAVRALIFLAVFVAAKLFSRRALSARTLFWAFLVIGWIWPGSYFEVSAQLTFAAILGLIVAARVSVGIPGGIVGSLIKAVLMNFIVWIFTSPVVWIWFENFVPLGVFWNLLFVAVFSLVGISLGGFSLIWFAASLPYAAELVNFSSEVLNVLIQLLETSEQSLKGTGLDFIGPDWY